MDFSPDFCARVLDSINDGILVVDRDGLILEANRAMRRLLGKSPSEPLTGTCWELLHGTAGCIDGCPFLKAVASGHRESLVFRQGDRWLQAIVDPLPDLSGQITQTVHIITDITERKEAEAALEERLRLGSLIAEVGQAITQSTTTAAMLQQCAELLVRHLGAAFARIWTFNPADERLELRASAGRYTHLDGPHGLIPLSRNIKISNIARTRRPHLTNAVIGDPQIADQEWARQEGLVAFAGFPLIMQDRLMGVMGLFARQPLGDFVPKALAGVADEIAVSINHWRSFEELRTNENRLRSLIENIPSIIVALTPDHRIMEFNPEAERLYGRTREEVIGEDFFKLFVPESLWGTVDGQIQKVMNGERPRGFIRHVIDKNGQESSISWDSNPLLDAAGQPMGAIAIGQDITAKVKAEKRDAVRFAVTQALAESSTLTDAAPRLLEASCLQLGFDLSELWLEDAASATLRLQYRWVDPSLDAGDFWAAGGDLVVSPGQGLAGQVWSRREPVWLSDVASSDVHLSRPQAEKAGLHAAFGVPITSGREVKGVISLFSRSMQPPDQELLSTMADLGSQIGQFMLRQRAEEQLWRNALYDELTGLSSRVLFKDRLEMELRQTRRYPEKQLAVLHLDVDRFKHINDTLGYAVGDQVLVAIARRLEECLRPEDTLARFSEDGFAVLVKNLLDIDHAVRVAQRIQEQLRKPLRVAGKEVFITVSIGIAHKVTGSTNAEDVLRDADMAMHRAKKRGKDRFVIFEEILRESSAAFYTLEQDLRLALERRELRVFYQPVVSLASGRLTGFEALIRWQHPEQGLVLPDTFIPLAEEIGLILPLGQWVLEEACRQMQTWQNGLLADSLVVSVNLSTRQFSQEDLVKQVARTLRETGLKGERLRLEITETALMEDAEAAIATLTTLKALGIQMSIDDFGTGYSSMRYLQRLPVDSLKIDSHFVSRINTSEEGASIVQAIISLAHKLGKKVVAEGIETEAQLNFLQAEGCDYGQGFLYSPALAPDAIAAAIAADPFWPQNQPKNGTIEV